MAKKTTSGINKHSGVQMLTYEAPTDEELYAKASLAAGEDYKTDYDLLFSQTKSKKDVMAQAIRDAERDYENAIKAMEKEYKSASESLSDEALARGLGRSSYALDLQSENLNNQQDSLTALLSDKMQAVNVIQNQIDRLEQEFIDNQTYLSKKKEDELKSKLIDLRQERDDTMRDVLEYNNDLIMDQKALAIKRLKARGKAVPIKRSASKSIAQTPKTILGEYNSLTSAGKLKFFNENQSNLKSALEPRDYNNVLSEIYAIVEQGTSPA